MTGPLRSPRSNRTMLRIVLFGIILATLPCYILGIGLWLFAPAQGNGTRATNTPELEATWTPLGGDVIFTQTPQPSLTPLLTFTPISPLLPTPPQFIPPVLPTAFPTAVPTAFIFPTDTLAPSLTPPPTNPPAASPTPLPPIVASNTPVPPTPIPPPSDTPLPPPSDTPVPAEPPPGEGGGEGG